MYFLGELGVLGGFYILLEAVRSFRSPAITAI
jgi:hypothetical protein